MPVRKGSKKIKTDANGNIIPDSSDAFITDKASKVDEGALKDELKSTSSGSLGIPSTSTEVSTVVSAEPERIPFDPIDVTNVIMKFGKILTGMPLYSYQEMIAWRIIYAVITFENTVLTVLLSRQSGKSETMAFVIDTLTVFLPTLAKVFPELDQFRSGFRVGLFAPQSDQVYTTYNRAMLRLSTENAEMIMADPDISTMLESDVRLELTNGSFLKGQVASKQSKIESKTYDLVILEESQDLDDYLVGKSIAPMVAATGGSLIKVGTTGTTKNHYWYDILKNRNKDRKILDERLMNHFEFNHTKIIAMRREQYNKDGKKFHLHYERHITNEKERYGEESQFFKLSYALRWDLESGMLITDEEWDKITNKKKAFKDDFDVDDDEIVAGLDIAKDINSTVLTIGLVHDEEDPFKPRKKEILGWLELSGLDYEAQHHLIMEAIVMFGIKRMYCDYTGVGKPVVDRLMYACGEHVEIVPYQFTRQSKSELYYNFTSEISSKSLIIPWHKKVRATEEARKFEEQMKNCQKFFDGPYLVCQKSDGYMDDYVDSCALMCMAGNHQGAETYEIEVDDYNPLYSSILANRERHDASSY